MCSCPQFQPDRRCFHVLSFAKIPLQADSTPLCGTKRCRGRVANAKDRYNTEDNLVQESKEKEKRLSQAALAVEVLKRLKDVPQQSRNRLVRKTSSVEYVDAAEAPPAKRVLRKAQSC